MYVLPVKKGQKLLSTAPRSSWKPWNPELLLPEWPLCEFWGQPTWATVVSHPKQSRTGPAVKLLGNEEQYTKRTPILSQSLNIRWRHSNICDCWTGHYKTWRADEEQTNPTYLTCSGLSDTCQIGMLIHKIRDKNRLETEAINKKEGALMNDSS